MAIAMTADTETPEQNGFAAPRIRPHHLAIWLGIGFAIVVVISGLLPQITDWHSDSPVQRVVFGGVPGPLQIAFYTIIPILVVWGAFQFADRVKNWERGRPAKRSTTIKNAPRRLADFAPVSTCAPCCATQRLD